ncbi:MAG: hypothetical protein ACP5C3_02360 [Methanomicrobiales archaeon]
MELNELNLIYDCEDEFILGNHLEINNKIIIPLIEISKIYGGQYLTCSIYPSAVMISEIINSENIQNSIFILESPEKNNKELQLKEFLNSKKEYMLNNFGIKFEINKINIIYPFKSDSKDFKNEYKDD